MRILPIFNRDVDKLIHKYPNYQITDHRLFTKPYHYMGVICYDFYNDLNRKQHQEEITQIVSKFEDFIQYHSDYEKLLKAELESQQSTYKLWVKGCYEDLESNEFSEIIDFELEILFRRDDFEYILKGIMEMNHVSLYPWLYMIIDEWRFIDDGLRPDLDLIIRKYREAYPPSPHFKPRKPVNRFPKHFWWRTIEHEIKRAEYEKFLEG